MPMDLPLGLLVASSSRPSLSFVFAFVLALVAFAVTVTPLPVRHFASTVVATACWIGTAELLTWGLMATYTRTVGILVAFVVVLICLVAYSDAIRNLVPVTVVRRTAQVTQRENDEKLISDVDREVERLGKTPNQAESSGSGIARTNRHTRSKSSPGFSKTTTRLSPISSLAYQRGMRSSKRI
jgi:hypothetical protein